MPAPLPQILCLHGGGTSAAIFYAQTRNVRAALKRHFDFVFLDAPFQSGPGPGVLPYFEDSGPYFRWFSDAAATQTGKMAEFAMVNKTLETALAQQKVKTSNIVGVLGFSQGTIVASLLLLQARWGDARWANLQFGVLMCGTCREDFVALMGDKLTVPTVHVHGLTDPLLPHSRMLADIFDPDTAVVVEFDGGHHMPTDRSDIERLASLMVNLAEA